MLVGYCPRLQRGGEHVDTVDFQRPGFPQRHVRPRPTARASHRTHLRETVHACRFSLAGTRWQLRLTVDRFSDQLGAHLVSREPAGELSATFQLALVRGPAALPCSALHLVGDRAGWQQSGGRAAAELTCQLIIAVPSIL